MVSAGGRNSRAKKAEKPAEPEEDTGEESEEEIVGKPKQRKVCGCALNCPVRPDAVCRVMLARASWLFCKTRATTSNNEMYHFPSKESKIPQVACSGDQQLHNSVFEATKENHISEVMTNPLHANDANIPDLT